MRALPKLAPTIVARPRIEAWLIHHARTPLRVIAAPAGSGKTTALVSSLLNRPRNAHYYAVCAGDDTSVLRAQIAAALGCSETFAEYGEVVAALAEGVPCEIVFDDIDTADPAAIRELLALVNDAPAETTFTAICRSRELLTETRLFTRGLAALCDAEKLAFTPDEIVGLADSLDVVHNDAEVRRLLEETEGWAVVVSGSIREAAAVNHSLSGAFDAWRRSHGRVFRRFLEEEAAATGDRGFVERLCNGVNVDDHETLAQLEQRGLFIRFIDGEFRPYRAVEALRRGDAPPAIKHERAAGVELLAIRLFGRFEARIGGRDIAWIRRRDARIMQYLALRPDCRASRLELQDAFWPSGDRSAAAQNLRTACSTIRKAIAAIVGYDAVERYFTVRGDVTINVDHSLIDVRRFSGHLSEGEADVTRGDVAAAIAHFRAAERLYAGPLLSGDLPEAAIAEHARIYEDAYFRVLERLADCWFVRGNVEAACNYATRVLDGRPDQRTMQKLLYAIERSMGRRSLTGPNEDDVPNVSI